MRDTTENIYQQKANQVIDFISANLHQPISLDAIADKINVSQRQLLRIMRSYLNESLSAYITRQRVERAVMYMQMEEISLTRLSEMAGYDNPQSFSKAFKKQFGISPKTYLNQLQTKLQGYVNSSGNRQNNIPVEIIKGEELELVYIRIFGKYGEEDPYKTAWGKLLKFLKINDSLSKNTRFIGISFDDPNITEQYKCRFYACATVDKKIVLTAEFGTIQIKKGKYAVYTLKGSYSGLQELYNNISVNFEYTLRHGVAYEGYLNSPQNTVESELITKVYIPIK